MENLFDKAYRCQSLGEYDQALDIFYSLLPYKKYLSEIHHNIGTIYRFQRRDEKAIEHYHLALETNGRAETHNDLAISLTNLGCIEEALKHHEIAFSIDQSSHLFADNLLSILISLGEYDEALKILDRIQDSDNPNNILVKATNTAIINWITGHSAQLPSIEIKNAPFFERSANLQRYYNYIFLLSQNSSPHPMDAPPLYIIGDSHVLSAAKIGQARLIIGIKMWHLASGKRTFTSECFKEQLKKIPQNSAILFIIGEIDCRPDEGIWKVSKGNPGAIIETTVNGYIAALDRLLSFKKPSSVSIQGIPYPGYELPEDAQGFLSMIIRVNELLRKACEIRNWHFLDVYFGSKKWHIDKYHLSPKAYNLLNKKGL